MEMTQELKDRLEAAVASLTRNDFLRPGGSYNDFIKEFSELLAQAKLDRVLLEAAGLDFSLMPLYEASLEMLVTDHAERVNAEADMGAAKGVFAERMPLAVKNKTLLMAVGRYVVARDSGVEAKRVYDWVRKGSGDVDTLNDNVAMVKFVRRWKDLASEVSPGGEVLDDARLTTIETEALDLLRIRAEAVTSADAATAMVERQGRLMTLCVRARSEIKLFAEMAFYNDTERYNRDYASPSRKPASSVPVDSPVETTAAPAP